MEVFGKGSATFKLFQERFVSCEFVRKGRCNFMISYFVRKNKMGHQRQIVYSKLRGAHLLLCTSLLRAMCSLWHAFCCELI